MSDTELAALTAAVSWQTAIINAEVAKFGESRTDPRTPEVLALHREIDRRNSQKIDHSNETEPAAIEINRLREWIRHEGARNNICTFGVLGEICSDCRCPKMKTPASFVIASDPIPNPPIGTKTRFA